MAKGRRADRSDRRNCVLFKDFFSQNKFSFDKMETRDDKRREKDRRDEDHIRKDDDQRGDRRNERRREKRDDYYESRK